MDNKWNMVDSLMLGGGAAMMAGGALAAGKALHKPMWVNPYGRALTLALAARQVGYPIAANFIPVEDRYAIGDNFVGSLLTGESSDDPELIVALQNKNAREWRDRQQEYLANRYIDPQPQGY